MITKNWKNMMFSYCCSSDICVKDVNGVKQNISCSYCNYPMITGKMATTSDISDTVYCKLGSGTTQETEKDIALENGISNLTCNSFSLTRKLSQNIEIDDNELRYIATFTNNTNEEIIVSEIGLIYDYGQWDTLLYRKTFSPITFAIGETKSFSIVLN